MSEASVPGMPDVRHWRGRIPKNLPAKAAEIQEQRRAANIAENFKMLALSGGSDDGAFAAGLVAAWTARGDRPELQVVTGVSTGALAAPFVFLGPDWDDELKEVYGGFLPDRIFKTRNLLAILPRASAADLSPLADTIAQFVDDGFIAEVAREHRRGRRLYVQTVNLDAQEAVIWEMGAIAASGASTAAEVFREVLLASASVPGLFPPILIEVVLDGAFFDEMHVDGGVISQSTVLSEWQPDLRGQFSYPEDDRPTYYLIRNGRISPEPEEIDYDLLEIAGRAASTMIKSQGRDDLLTAHNVARLRDADLYLAWIGEDFDAPYPAPFDPSYMRALYQYGYDLMAEPGRPYRHNS